MVKDDLYSMKIAIKYNFDKDTKFIIFFVHV